MKKEPIASDSRAVKIGLWNKYRSVVEQNCLRSTDELSGLPYWRNKLFATIMIYLVPLSLIAVLPGVVMSFLSGAIPLGIFDILIGFFILFIALIPGWKVEFRKTLFIALLYATAIVLLYYLGSFGPGLLYLLAVTVFIILIFSRRIAVLSVGLNALICVVFGIAIEYKMIDSPLIPQYSVGAWIAVSSNVILLSAVMSVLLPTLFNGLQNIIDEQTRLKKQMEKDQQGLKKALEVVKYKNNELEQFAYIASHDLQEPLRSIAGLIAMMKKRHDENPEDVEIMKHIVTSSERMRSLVTGLLEYARIGVEKKMTLTDCNALVKEVVEDLSVLIKETGAVITVKKLPLLDAYQAELKQLFQNLITNAIKFRKKDVVPQIEIGAREYHSNWAFYVEDNGIGIAEEYKEAIFIIFKRLHTRSKYEGTGIGLAHCRKIVELHGGKIYAESEEGKGTTFHFTILKTLSDYEE